MAGLKKEVRERLEKSLDDSPLTQAELARRVGRARSTVNGWLTGHSEPNSESLAGVCRELGVSADYLLGLEPAPITKEQAWNVILGDIAPSGDQGRLPDKVRAIADLVLADLTQRPDSPIKGEEELVRLHGEQSPRWEALVEEKQRKREAEGDG